MGVEVPGVPPPFEERLAVNCISHESPGLTGVTHGSGGGGGGYIVKLLHLTGVIIVGYRLMLRPILPEAGEETSLFIPLKLPDTMDKQATVVFRNVGQLYFPQTRVECHYSLTSDHQWSSQDWIGIFEIGWSSVKQFHTYTWALVPEGYVEGTNVNCCALFHARYLPRPSAAEYQFVYVDRLGEVAACSRPFTFRAPKPLEELETLKEERDEEENGDEVDGDEEELLLVVPRAQLLQSQLEESLKRQAGLQQALDAAKRETDDEKENRKTSQAAWEREREAMKDEISGLRYDLRYNCDMLKNIEGKQKNARYSQESLTCELSKLLTDKAESEQRITDLEDDVRVLTEREKDGAAEAERLKERLKKMSSQMKHNEEKRRSLQVESEARQLEVRGLQERLDLSEHTTESLRRELRELATRQAHTHTELHQARLQAAQLTLQLSEENLVLREERANWALERETYKQAGEADKKKWQELSLEVERKEDWLQEERTEREKLEAELGNERDCNRVLLSDAGVELQELKASLRRVAAEREEQQLETQDLVNYIHQLEQRLETLSETKSNGETSTPTNPDSSEGDKDAPSVTPRSVGSPLFLLAHLDQSNRAEAAASDSQGRRMQQEPQADARKQLILPQLVDPVLSELADSPMW